MRVSFGLALPQAGPSASAHALRSTAVAAEQLGYDSVWLGDHVVIPEEVDSAYPYGSFDIESRQVSFDALGTLGFLAGVTSSVKLGLSVLLVPLREPRSTAKQLATIDTLAHGRLIVGVGAGWLKSEFTALGFSDSQFKQRGQVLDESLDLYRQMWAHQQTSFFSGRHFSLPKVRAFPKPVSKTGIPIWAGGNSAPALRRAARLDGWHALRLSVADFEASARTIREHRERADLHPQIDLSLRCFVGQGPPNISADYDMAGAEDDVVEMLSRYIGAGCSHFVLDLHQSPHPSLDAYLETAQWFAERVRPLVATAGGPSARVEGHPT